MKNRYSFFLFPAIVLAMPCFAHDDIATAGNLFEIENGDVHVHAKAAPDAVVTPEGNLSIAGHAIAVIPAQQELLKHYHAKVLALRDHAYETGMGGVDIAAEALAVAAAAIGGDDTTKSNSKVDVKAEKIKASVAQICSDLADIRSTQDSIAGQLPAFHAYATLDSNDVAKCRNK